MTDRGIRPGTARRFRLGYSGEQDNRAIAGRLAIPYLTPAGAWHIKYRCVTDHKHKDTGCPKYTYESGADQHLYNASALLTADQVVLCEGELDAVTVEQAGVPAVAYPGVDTWRANKHWRWCFDSVDEVVIVADGDEPGRKAAEGVRDSLRDSVHAEVRVAYMPEGHDSNSFIREFGDLDYLDKIGML